MSGARPNFVKIAPIAREMKRSATLAPVLVHTGQHYDTEMSERFFKDLRIPKPDIYLGVGSGSHAEQTARIMVEFEKVMLERKPGLVVVVGDVNSTMACAIVAAKLLVPVAHVEAGLRSFDRGMPEEINRIVTDSISDFFFTSEPSGERNLIREGVPKKKIFFVGNVMIDSLIDNLSRIGKGAGRRPSGLRQGEYGVVTLHRPSNVDNRETLDAILGALEEIAAEVPLFFPMHPRTLANVKKFGMENRFAEWAEREGIEGRIYRMPPLGYLQFQAMTSGARLVITDSGGIQEETTYLRIPCITIRDTTERPITVEIGTNVLVKPERRAVLRAAREALDGYSKPGRMPKLWDGKTAARIVRILEKRFN